MNDLEKVINLFNELNIDYRIKEKIVDDDNVSYPEDGKVTSLSTFPRSVKENTHGYFGFYTEFLFTKKGKFISIGAWE